MVHQCAWINLLQRGKSIKDHGIRARVPYVVLPTHDTAHGLGTVISPQNKCPSSHDLKYLEAQDIRLNG